MENDGPSQEIEDRLSIKYVKTEIIYKCSDIRSIELKMDQFINCIEKDLWKKFPSDFEKGAFNALISTLFDGPIFLYAVSMNTAAILELHSILERFALRDVSRILANPLRRSIVKKILERYTLPDLAKILHNDLNILDEEDMKFAVNLNKLRNGIAHKNERVISNALLSGRRISLLDIDHEVNRIDIKPYLLGGIIFLYKLFELSKASEAIGNEIHKE